MRRNVHSRLNIVMLFAVYQVGKRTLWPQLEPVSCKIESRFVASDNLAQTLLVYSTSCHHDRQAVWKFCKKLGIVRHISVRSNLLGSQGDYTRRECRITGCHHQRVYKVSEKVTKKT